MQVGDLVRRWGYPTDDFWLILKVTSGKDIPESPKDKMIASLEVSNSEGMTRWFLNYQCEVVSCK